LVGLKVVTHPYAQAVLTQLRNKETGQIEFRKGLVRLGRVLGLEIIREFPVKEIYVETPLGRAKGVKIEGIDKVVIITVLRAAWPMTEGLIKIFPLARQGIVSARRMEEEGMKEGYKFDIEVAYVKVPKIDPDDTVIITDPMLATGSTLSAILKTIVKYGKARKYIIVSAIATPVAVNRLNEVANDLDIDLTIYTVAVDKEVNNVGYIVPGLGDAGDRAFGG